LLESVGGSELLADVLRAFEFVDQGDGVVFYGDGAVSLYITDEGVSAETEFAGALTGLDEHGGREVRPIEIRFVQ